MSTDAEFEGHCVSSMLTYIAFKEAQYAEIMRLADEYDASQYTDEAAIKRAALDAAVRKLAGLLANSETAARPGTE